MDKKIFNNLIIGEDKKGNCVYLSDDVRNPHVCILGTSGTGKSTVAMSLLLQRYFMGESVMVFNWRRCLSMENVLPDLYPVYKDNRVQINVAKDKMKLPLCTKFQNIDGQEESEESVKHRLAALLTVAGGLTPSQSAVISRAVGVIYAERLFETEGIRSIKNYLEAQEQQTALNAAGRLRALCDENYIVDGNFAKEHKIYEVDLNGIQYDDQTVLVKFVLDFLLRCANQGMFVKNRVTIFIDECQNLDFRPESTMTTLLNETRKMGLSLILAAPKILSGTKGMSVIQQSGTILYFSPEPGERRKIAKQIHPQKVDEYTFQLSRLKVGEYLASGSFMEENGKPLDITRKLSVHIPNGQRVVEKIPLDSD